MNVKLYLKKVLVGKGTVTSLDDVYKMPTGYIHPGRIEIKMTTQLKAKLADRIIIDNNKEYKINLDDVLDYSIGSIITGDIY